MILNDEYSAKEKKVQVLRISILIWTENKIIRNIQQVLSSAIEGELFLVMNKLNAQILVL
jgi:hypothetical protein